MRHVEFVFFDAGGGHRAAVSALQMGIRECHLPWRADATNLQEVLDPLDPLKKLCRFRIEDAYNMMLRREWTLGSTKLLHVLRFGVRLYHEATVELFEERWRELRPDMVVSCVPHFNRPLRDSFFRAFPERPFVTILTDLADFPPHFWIESEPQYFICGSQRAVEQALAIGHPLDRIFSVSGMILHPRFYEPFTEDKRSARQKLGLDPDLPTALLLFGGHGSKSMAEIAERLDRSKLDLQLILLCGRNQSLERMLRERPSRLPRLVEGFTTRVSEFMRAADFFIGKPGPGSLSEAVAMHLPVIVESNAWTLPQERYNAQWVLENDIGIVLPNFRKIESAVARMIQPETLARFRANTAKLKNQALFEVLDALDRILHGEGSASADSNRCAGSVPS